jgi:hypothetical protein
MKFNRVLLLSILFFSFLSCGDDDDDDEPLGEEFLTAILDGQTFQHDQNRNNASLNANVQQGANGLAFSFRGVKEIFGETDINLRGSVSGYTGVGIYTLENAQLNFRIFGNGYNVNTNINPESTGILSITKDDGEFYEGTFEFVAFANSGNKATVTDGRFKVKF